mgnify:CR=1 FL=1
MVLEPKSGPWPGQPAANSHPASSVSLRWRVMLLAMSMVVISVVLMAVALIVLVAQILFDAQRSRVKTED